MSNIREDTVKVYCLKLDVRKNLKRLRSYGYPSRLGKIVYTSRVERQIKDAEKFLLILNEAPYANCKTLDELMQRISRKRNTLKKQLAELDPNASGHQISIFEIMDEMSESEKQETRQKIEALKEEIHWLHKCLGICKNKDYFN